MIRRALPPPLASGARTATGGTWCAICGCAIAVGTREAQLADSGTWVHTHCVAQLADAPTTGRRTA